MNWNDLAVLQVTEVSGARRADGVIDLDAMPKQPVEDIHAGVCMICPEQIDFTKNDDRARVLYGHALTKGFVHALCLHSGTGIIGSVMFNDGKNRITTWNGNS